MQVDGWRGVKELQAGLKLALSCGVVWVCQAHRQALFVRCVMPAALEGAGIRAG